MTGSKTHNPIPDGLNDIETAVYRKIMDTVTTLRKQNFDLPHVVVITDVGKDYDDLAAMIVLKELHRLGAVKLEGFITNLLPEDARAHLARQSLDLLGLEEIPVRQGTRGTEKNISPDLYEFPVSIMGGKPYPKQPRGLDLLQQLKDNAERDNYQLTFLLISSLQDISEFERSLRPKDSSQIHPLKHVIAKVVLQGNYKLDQARNDTKEPTSHSILKADQGAANNDFHWSSAQDFHSFLDREGISSVVYNKIAAYDTPLRPTIFSEMAETGQTLGIALRDIEAPQNILYYKGACRMINGKPAPIMKDRDQQWFLLRRTTYFDTRDREINPELLPDPESEEIVEYCKVIVYDVLAALGTCPEAILDALNVLEPPDYEKQPDHNELHRVVGVTPKMNPETATQEELDAAVQLGEDEENPFKSPASTNAETMKNVIEALLKGALLDCKAKGIGQAKVKDRF
ncbi:uncharacterized protein EAF01_008996 [Botrytis porri]|uniref:Inosine/uridine-preferring nucleoside hydrolase domain-containing protein n=1 Tax=Botrytis porri TaxID=87229 RepID=A0A4Z1KP32_9HELO|nr:uncharacterized protein EAF01_008996 [Botrytis porri]KAF7898030.1 hypothetical protein EAF01_008996 [Botrytis porri]TGO83139.1 hypothetical protein BPOR_0697g00040 [Botrytis porri]